MVVDINKGSLGILCRLFLGKSLLILIYTLLVMPLSSFANLQLANLKQDMELVQRELVGLRSEVELLRRENAQLRISLEQVSRQVKSNSGNSQNVVGSMGGRLDAIERRVSVSEQTSQSLQTNTDRKLKELISEMNKQFQKLTTNSSPSGESAPSFSNNYPSNGFVHKVEKGETVSSIAKKYHSQVDWVINANQILDPKKVFVGKELFVPQK